MTAVLNLIYSLPFFVGGLVGVFGMRAYCWAQARWEDTHHPNPDGTRHTVAPISRVWLGGLLALLVVGYVLLQTANTEAHYKSLAASVAACQREFNEALTKRAEITAEDTRLSREKFIELADYNDATSTWINRLINPPAEFAELPTDDPRRQAWGIDVTRVYFERTNKINQRIADITMRQKELDEARSRNPLPEPSCGK